MASDVFENFDAYHHFIQDVTDTDYWTQIGSTQGFVFAILKHRLFLTNRTKTRLKSAV